MCDLCVSLKMVNAILKSLSVTLVIRCEEPDLTKTEVVVLMHLFVLKQLRLVK